MSDDISKVTGCSDTLWIELKHKSITKPANNPSLKRLEKNEELRLLFNTAEKETQKMRTVLIRSMESSKINGSPNNLTRRLEGTAE